VNKGRASNYFKEHDNIRGYGGCCKVGQQLLVLSWNSRSKEMQRPILSVDKITPMTVNELCTRFPEISLELCDEPTLAEFAATFGDWLGLAHKPSSCSTGHDPANHFYLKLVGPITYFSYGLATRERVVKDIQDLLDAYAADPEGFAASLLPEGTVNAEVRGPGCS
tara:strand:- start:4785 stop:5282 length:498 start_codon:yes stop_codon:yes gene_type:complete